MPLYRVVEEYPQATVRRVLLVEAPDIYSARHNPHVQTIIADGFYIDEGGEAVTEEAKVVKMSEIPAVIVEINELHKK